MKAYEHPFYCERCDKCVWLTADTREQAKEVLLESWSEMDGYYFCSKECMGGDVYG